MTSYEADTATGFMLAPRLVQAEGGVLDPACKKAVVKVLPYPGMANGDRLLLLWSGIDAEGQVYWHEESRFVREAVGQ